MEGVNIQIPPVILQTRRGNIPITNLNIGDIVYDYKTYCEFEIEGFVDSKIEDIYKITFNDERIAYYKKSEMEYMKNINIYPSCINYNKKRIINPLCPDPYIAGALLIYGDMDDEYLNLPFDSIAINNLFAHKYQLNYGGVLNSKGNVHFRYNGTSDDNLIRWDEFFSNYAFYANPSNSKLPIISLEYQRASIDDRWQFINGIFDIGYNKEMFPKSCGIIHKYESNLIEVQKILWSLGILSIISYVPKVPISCVGKNYKLDIIGTYKKYPGFFYDINSIEDIIKCNEFIMKIPNFKLQIKSIEWYSKGYTRNIVLKKPHILYLTDNFLPRISEYK